jgi:uncharacterized integral membrane protein
MSGQYPPPTPPPQPPQQRGWSPTSRLIAGMLALVLVLIFIFENTKSVKVRFIIPEVKLPLYFALLVAAVLGGLVALFIQWRWRSKRGEKR